MNSKMKVKARSNAPKTKLLAIDGTWLMHRAYHVRQSSVKYMVFGWVCKFIVQTKATHAFVAFDYGKTFRNELYSEYKAGRARNNVSDHRESTVKYINDFRVHTELGNGHEADDILATASMIEGVDHVLLVTPDKDSLQNISERCSVLKPGIQGNPDRVIGLKELQTEHGLTPEQWLDWQTLMGDKTDNIPKLMQPAAAKKLVLQHGSLKQYLLSDKEYAEENSEALNLNRSLVKLRTNAFEGDLSKYAVSNIDRRRSDCSSAFYKELVRPKGLF